MRTSSLVTISLPPKMVAESEKVAKQQNMTRSELLRTALRFYLEETSTQEAIRIFKKEKREGKLKVLKGSLADLI
ncbi:MAG TPA: ribbon-helix-helix domain-containing protein [Patescibacteria group bacterium]|nr:ribbon-helix-helix domain-containing protein [Patescibacteria group bacterium]